jgi:F-type H+-transporting ATPase subunit b
MSSLSLLLSALPAAASVPLAQSLIRPTFGLIFWKGLAFLIFAYLLYRYAWGPITDALEEREERIDASMTKAERALAEAKEIHAENEKSRRESEQKAREVLREAREEAETLREEEKTETRQDIQQMQEQARAEIEREKESALSELRSEVADLAIQAAGKILDENLNDQRQRRLVDDFIDDLPRN